MSKVKSQTIVYDNYKRDEVAGHKLLLNILKLLDVMRKFGIGSADLTRMPEARRVGPSTVLVDYIHRQICKSNDRFRNGR